MRARPEVPEGLVARFRHLRRAGAPLHDVMELQTRWQWREHGFAVLPQGGRTEVSLYNQTDKPGAKPVAVGAADCSLGDNYNKKIGRDVALGRALKALRDG